MRTINSILNSGFAVVSQFIILIFAFITRTVFIRILGSEYLGFDALFTNILSILSIVDLGLGTALNFSLYSPIRNNERQKVAAIVQYFKKIFCRLGVLLFILAFCITPFIGLFVKGSVNSIPYMQKVFVFYAFLTFSSYFFTDVRTIYYAHKQNYKVLMFDFLAKIFTKTLQVIILLIHPSYLWYLGIEIIITLFFNFRLMKKAHKEYSEFYTYPSELKEDERQTIFNDIKFLSLSKIANVGINGTDSIIISKFVGTAALGVYSNYFLILSSASNLLWSLLNGVVASLGDLFAENDSTKIHQIFNLYNFISVQVSTFYAVATISLIQPFIHMWIGKNYVMSFTVVLVVIFNNYYGLVTAPLSNVIVTKGLFKQELPIRLLQVVINLVVSVVLAVNYGLLGVFVGTAVSNIISYFLIVYMVVKSGLNLKLTDYIFKEVKYIIISFLQIAAICLLNQMLAFQYGIISFILNMCMVIVSFLLLELLFYRKNTQMLVLVNIIKSQIGRYKGAK